MGHNTCTSQQPTPNVMPGQCLWSASMHMVSYTQSRYSFIHLSYMQVRQNVKYPVMSKDTKEPDLRCGMKLQHFEKKNVWIAMQKRNLHNFELNEIHLFIQIVSCKRARCREDGRFDTQKRVSSLLITTPELTHTRTIGADLQTEQSTYKNERKTTENEATSDLSLTIMG